MTATQRWPEGAHFGRGLLARRDCKDERRDEIRSCKVCAHVHTVMAESSAIDKERFQGVRAARGKKR